MNKETTTDQNNKYAWAGNVFDYLDMYKKDVQDILGVNDIRLYKDGLRMAVGLCFDASNQWEDKDKKRSFQGYLVHQLMSHIDDLTRKCNRAEEMLTGVNQAVQMLTQSAMLMRNHVAPTGFVERIFPEIKQPDAFEKALAKQRQGDVIKGLTANTPITAIENTDKNHGYMG